MAVHEKGRCVAKLIAKNRQGHAGLAANHQTPTMRMAKFIAEVDEKKPFIRRLHLEVKGMFEAMAPHMSFPMCFVFSNLWLFSNLLIQIIPKMNAAAGEMLGWDVHLESFQQMKMEAATARLFFVVSMIKIWNKIFNL